VIAIANTATKSTIEKWARHAFESGNAEVMELAVAIIGESRTEQKKRLMDAILRKHLEQGKLDDELPRLKVFARIYGVGDTVETFLAELGEMRERAYELN
jgi:hypothetical protein